MADLRDLFQRAALEPHGEVSVDGLARRALRRRRARQRVGALMAAAVVFAAVVAVVSRSDTHPARVAIGPSSESTVSTSSSVPPATTTGAELWAVQMVSSTTAFAAGPGRIIRSDDGGAHWRVQEISCSSCPGVLNFNSIDMLDPSTGWATSSIGLFHTSDGEHWYEQVTGLEHEPGVVHFISPQEGWIVTAPWGAGEFVGLANAVVAHTSDGGATWTPLTGLPPDVQSVCFTHRDDGWLATRNEVYRSVDGGATWKLSFTAPVMLSQETGTIDLQCASPDAAWIQFATGIGAAGTSPWALYTTADAGQSWTPVAGAGFPFEVVVPPVGGSYPGQFSVIDPLNAFLAAYSPGLEDLQAVFITDTVALAPATTITKNVVDGQFFTPLAASFADRAHGIVVGDANAVRPTIYVTSDGGQTWTPVMSVGLSPVSAFSTVEPPTDRSS